MSRATILSNMHLGLYVSLFQRVSSKVMHRLGTKFLVLHKFTSIFVVSCSIYIAVRSTKIRGDFQEGLRERRIFVRFFWKGSAPINFCINLAFKSVLTLRLILFMVLL